MQEGGEEGEGIREGVGGNGRMEGRGEGGQWEGWSGVEGGDEWE